MLGRVPYERGLALQQAAVDVCSAKGSEQLILLEHPNVVTLGRGADVSHIISSEEELAERSIQVHRTGRGGDVTYHGPGQLVGYPIINLRPDRCDVHRYVRDLEEVLIRTIADFGIVGERIKGLTGVWVDDKKIAAIGVRIARWITSHGFALNVNTDLSYFQMIVPCGISGKGIASMSGLTGGKELSLPEVGSCLSMHFGEVFNRDMLLLE